MLYTIFPTLHTYVGSTSATCCTLHRFNFSYVVYTEIDTTVPVPVEASLAWPSLSPHKELHFPETIIGNSSVSVCGVCLHAT